MARKSKKKKWARRAELKVRLPEPLRLNLEIAARRAGRSMNAEAVWRLSESVLGNRDPYAIAAEAILNGLDERIVTIIEDMILRANAEKEVRALYRKDAEEGLSGEPGDLAPRVGDVDPGPHLPAEKAVDPDAGGVIDLMDAIRQMLGREPTLEELHAARRRASAAPSDEEPELPMPHHRGAKGGKS
jgi:plasmid stability protein